MTEPVTALLIALGFFINLAAVRFFKTLDGDVFASWQTPLVAGAAGGIALRLLNASHPASVGVVITAVALYVRLMGNESEPFDGMILGACSGAAAAIPLLFRTDTPCLQVASCLGAGAVAGFGVTFASRHIADRVRRYALDAVTTVAAIAVAWMLGMLASAGLDSCRIALSVAALVPIFIFVVVFQQWPDVRAELSHEASLGFMADADVRRTAHPLLRLGSGGWSDRRAHREFVRLANKIALRKRQQRARSEEMARLYQLEIIKLRMQLEKMTRINRDAAEVRSDTMASSK